MGDGSNPVGRPTKFTPDIGRAICALVEEIGFLAIAAEKMRISRKTAYRWRDENEDFAADVAAARAVHVERVVKEVKNPEWLLQRIDPELFKQSDNVKIAHAHVELTREDALAELRELATTDPEIAAWLKTSSD